MDSEDEGYPSSDATSSGGGCIHEMLEEDKYSAEVLVSQLADDASRCPECSLTLDAVKRVKPDFIAENSDGNGAIQMLIKDPDPVACGAILEVRLRRCPEPKYGPDDDEYWDCDPESDPDIIYRIGMLRKSSLEHFYERSTHHDSRFKRLGRTLEIVENSASQKAFDRASKWLDDCVHNHPACKPPDDGFMPLRLIDVGSESQAPRLFERPPRDSTGRRAPYACLSYCWGLKPGEEVLKTTTENCDVHKAEIPIKSAPPAIQDAVDLCRGLGIKYLWVDSLCLTQDNLQMWLSEAAEMDSIYLNSHLTIAALEPHTCKLHFLGPQPFGTPDWQYFMQTDTVCDDGQTVDMVIRPEGSNPAKVAATKTTSLDTRAWCFQESLLPNRRLCFDGNEMIWECLCTKICECGHAIRRPPTLRYSVLGAGMKEKMLKGVPLQSGPKPFVYQHEERDFDLGNMNINAKWRRLISDYSSRHMTVPKDRLRAVSGLAKVVLDWFRKDRKTTSAPVEYLAGLWKHELQLDLAWVVTEFRPKPSVREGETPWNVPTWSWASAWGGVMFPGAMTPKWKYTARIRNMCRVEKVDCEKEYQKDETSAVTEGRAKLYGTLVAVKPSREADLGNSREAETFWFGDAGKDPDQARERKWFVRAENGEENGEEVAVMFDEPLSLPSESQSTDHPKKGLPTNDRYYCFRLFAWLADDTRVYRGDGGEITMGPETWFLLLRSSQRVQGAMERVGIGKHESKDGIPCPIFKDAKDEIVEIV